MALQRHLISPSSPAYPSPKPLRPSRSSSTHMRSSPTPRSPVVRLPQLKILFSDLAGSNASSSAGIPNLFSYFPPSCCTTFTNPKKGFYKIPGQKPAASGSTFELGLVMFNAHGPYSGWVVQRSSWTKDVDSFLGWLSSITFCGGGLEDAAIAESEALMMFAIPQNGYQTQQSAEGKQC